MDKRRGAGKVKQADPQWCVTMERHRRFARLYPEYRRARRQFEAETQQYQAEYDMQGPPTNIVTIPVVVHVVYRLAVENISDNQIKKQIEVLNADFGPPPAFPSWMKSQYAAVAADTRIQFGLAVRDPQCNPTNGITRTRIGNGLTGFTVATIDDAKSGLAGGADPWPYQDYLNIWVVNITDNAISGYAPLPTGALWDPLLDGVVVSYTAFGIGPTAQPPRDLGRSCTHEVGHWLNLLHIWGDDSGACSADDQCADTPLQGKWNLGSPSPTSWPASCGNTGDMFMNYMDYTDDAAKFMFTGDQALRMQAALSLQGRDFSGSSGLIPVAGPQSLWIRDHMDDSGTEPDVSTLPPYISDDIWVRNGSDGLTNQSHQTPLSGQTNHVYVRIRNRGCQGSAPQSGVVKLYWAKGSSSLSWPAPWDGSVTVPALMGGLIGTQSVTVAGGGAEISSFDWVPPDPADYSAFGADSAHFCLLVRIEIPGMADFGMTVAETGDLAANVRNNNRIAWKNITIFAADDNGATAASMLIGKFDREKRNTRITFKTPRTRGLSLFDCGFILVELRGALKAWKRPLLRGRGCERLSDGRIMIKRSGAQLIGPPLRRGQVGAVRLQFVPGLTGPLGSRILELDVIELNRRGKLLGGVRFLLSTHTPRRTPSHDCRLQRFDGVSWLAQQSAGCSHSRD